MENNKSVESILDGIPSEIEGAALYMEKYTHLYVFGYAYSKDNIKVSASGDTALQALIVLESKLQHSK